MILKNTNIKISKLAKLIFCVPNVLHIFIVFSSHSLTISYQIDMGPKSRGTYKSHDLIEMKLKEVPQKDIHEDERCGKPQTVTNHQLPQLNY